MHFSIKGQPWQLQNGSKTNQYLIRPEGILHDQGLTIKKESKKQRKVEQSNEGMANSECHFFYKGTYVQCIETDFQIN